MITCFWELIFQNSSVKWCVLRLLQEDEDALYHVTGGRPNRVPLQRARPEGPKKATPSVMQFLNMGELVSSFPRAPPTKRSQQLHSNHGSHYYVEEPDD